MNVSYQSFASSDSCVICLETMENTDTVAHTRGEELQAWHPVHRKCIQTWLINHNTCPECRVVVDRSPLAPQKSWGDRLITEVAGSVAQAVGSGSGLLVAGLIVRVSVAGALALAAREEVGVLESGAGAVIAGLIAVIPGSFAGLLVGGGLLNFFGQFSIGNQSILPT